MKIMKFSFVAPLQSWGEDAKWDTRSTATMPTKSGIVGYLGCCMGWPRGDERLNRLNEGILIAIRCERPGDILNDFQTVQGTDGYFLSAEGKRRSGGGTIITPKQYLQNAAFTVFLQGEDELMNQCWSAMMNPVWTPYLGRKNCVPAVPVVPEWVTADSLKEAVSIFEADRNQGKKAVNVEMDLAAYGDGAEEERTYTRSDSIIHAERNQYHSRAVCSFAIIPGGDLS